MLAGAAEAVLQASPGTVTAIPFQPGIGKSTLIRALLTVFAQEFQHATPIAQTIGGVIVVVEKTAEAEELEALCNDTGAKIVAKAISSPNDYNLSKGKCLNGTARAYKDCPGRSCPDYGDCPLIRSARQIHDTPILIMLHARYQMYMEDMSRFLTWQDDADSYCRSLLLVDEIPPFIEDNALNLSVINRLETCFAQFKPSYQVQYRNAKASLSENWNETVRSLFLRIVSSLQAATGLHDLVSRDELSAAGFNFDALKALKSEIINYLETTEHDSIRLINALLYARHIYYAVGQEESLFFPRLRTIHGERQSATFLFSSTAALSPELSRNPDITAFPDKNLGSFQHLHINVQKGELLNRSKSGLEKGRNLAALTAYAAADQPAPSQDIGRKARRIGREHLVFPPCRTLFTALVG